MLHARVENNIVLSIEMELTISQISTLSGFLAVAMLLVEATRVGVLGQPAMASSRDLIIRSMTAAVAFVSIVFILAQFEAVNMTEEQLAMAMVTLGTMGLAALFTLSMSVVSPNDIGDMSKGKNKCCTDLKCCKECKPRPRHRPSLLKANYGHMYITSSPRSNPDSPVDNMFDDNDGSITKIEILNNDGMVNGDNFAGSIPRPLSLLRQFDEQEESNSNSVIGQDRPSITKWDTSASPSSKAALLGFPKVLPDGPSIKMYKDDGEIKPWSLEKQIEFSMTPPDPNPTDDEYDEGIPPPPSIQIQDFARLWTESGSRWTAEFCVTAVTFLVSIFFFAYGLSKSWY